VICRTKFQGEALGLAFFVFTSNHEDGDEDEDDSFLFLPCPSVGSSTWNLCAARSGKILRNNGFWSDILGNWRVKQWFLFLKHPYK